MIKLFKIVKLFRKNNSLITFKRMQDIFSNNIWIILEKKKKKEKENVKNFNYFTDYFIKG